MTLIRTVLIKGISTLVLLLIHATVFAQQVANIDEFNRAVAHAKPGDTIVLANGEWKDVEPIFKGYRRQAYYVNGANPGRSRHYWTF